MKSLNQSTLPTRRDFWRNGFVLGLLTAFGVSTVTVVVLKLLNLTEGF